MQVVKQMLLILILLPLAIVLFMPKKELYYLLEQRLAQKHIMITDESLREGPFSLTILHPVVRFNGAPVAHAERITLWSLLLYSKADIKAVAVAEGLPTEVNASRMTAIHSILSPLRMRIEGQSSLGSVEGALDLQGRRLHLELAEGGNNQALSAYLKKGEKGWYYESRF